MSKFEMQTPPNMLEFRHTSVANEWVMRITADKRIEVNEDVEVTEAAKKVLEAIQYMLTQQPEQEPVALRHSFDGYGYLYTDSGFGSSWIEWAKRSHKDVEPLYTTPPQRKPLPYEKVADLWLARFDTNEYDEVFMNFARAIEAAHGIKE